MTTRVLAFALTLGVAGLFCASPCRAKTGPPPLVSAHPVYEGTLPGVMATAPDRDDEGGLAERDPFHAGSLTFQALVGSYNQSRIGPNGPAIDYVPVAVRFGYILNTPSREDWLRGCVEVLLETNYSPIVHSAGTYFAGPNIIARFNFVQPECALVPYIQGGIGCTFNDAWKTSDSRPQPLIGDNLEFLLRAEVGVRYMVTECFSLDIEAGLHHISNAGLAKNNGGINNIGGTVGLTYFFGRRE